MIYFRNHFCVLTQQNKISSQNEMLNQAFELRLKAKAFDATFFIMGGSHFSSCTILFLLEIIVILKGPEIRLNPYMPDWFTPSHARLKMIKW